MLELKQGLFFRPELIFLFKLEQFLGKNIPYQTQLKMLQSCQW